MALKERVNPRPSTRLYHPADSLPLWKVEPLQLGESVCPNRPKKRLRHEPINFGRKPVNPKAATMNFGIWLSKSCATRISRRPRALQTRYDGQDDELGIPVVPTRSIVFAGEVISSVVITRLLSSQNGECSGIRRKPLGPSSFGGLPGPGARKKSD